jgi:hypothetical protein
MRGRNVVAPQYPRAQAQPQRLKAILLKVQMAQPPLCRLRNQQAHLLRQAHGQLLRQSLLEWEAAASCAHGDSFALALGSAAVFAFLAI